MCVVMESKLLLLASASSSYFTATCKIRGESSCHPEPAKGGLMGFCSSCALTQKHKPQLSRGDPADATSGPA